MFTSVPLRRSTRLKNVQSNQNTNLGSSNTIELEVNKPDCRKRGRPRILVPKEQALKNHKADCDSDVTETLSARHLFNQEKDMPFQCEAGRPRKIFSGDDENSRSKEAGGNAQTSNSVKGNVNIVSGPINSPIWIGNICVCHKNFGVVKELSAEISSKASVKVFEVAKLLPELIHAEMLSRQDIWPACFDTCPPTDDFIDLYILPINRRSERAFESLLNEMTGKDLVLKAFLDDVPILVFSSLQLTYHYWRTTSGKYYLWAVFVGKNAFFPHEKEKYNSFGNFDCTAALNLANKLQPFTEYLRTFPKNASSGVNRIIVEKVRIRESILMDNGCILPSDAPSTLNGKSIQEHPTGRSVNEGLTNEGIYETNADFIRNGADTTEGTSVDNYTESASKEVIGEETCRKGPTISVPLGPNVKETISDIGFPEAQLNYLVEGSLGESICAIDQSAAEGIGASCSPRMAYTVEKCKWVSGIASVDQLQETIPNPPTLQLYSEEERASSESINTSLLHMAITFDDLTNLDEISSTCVEQVDSYSVQPSYTPVLRAIMDKHGDIAQDSPIRCSKMLTLGLERICEVVQDLEAVRFIDLRKSHLQSLHSAIADAELLKLDVEWLRRRYKELVEAVDQIMEYRSLKVSRKKMEKIVSSKKKILSLKKTEMLKLQSEIEILESEVAQISAKTESLSGAISNVTSKCKHFPHNSVMDGLL